MRTAALVFFYGCLCAGAWWAFMGWARRTVARHVDAGLRDPRIDRQVELASGRPGQGEGLAFFAEYHDVLTEAERILKEAAP